MNKLKAFTLLEMVITLGITVIVLQISMLVPKKIFHDQEIKNFKVELNRKFNILKEKALINDEQLSVIFDRDNHSIIVKNLKKKETKK